MILGRLLGWILFFAGVSVLAHDVMLWRESGRWAPILLGQLWYDANPPSLNLAQVIVQRYLWPPLWDGAIVRVLLCWACAVLIGAAVEIHVPHSMHDDHVGRALSRYAWTWKLTD